MKRSRGLGRRNQCPSGKRRWRDHSEASEELNRLTASAKRRSKVYSPGRIYECHMCQGWHMTAQPLRSASIETQRPLKTTRPLKRSARPGQQRKPIAQRSEKRRRAMQTERVPFVLDVLARRPWCEAELPWCCTGRSTDVNELMRGIHRTDCWLDDGRVTSVCGGCHGHITDNPHWAKAHGHQVEEAHLQEAAFDLAEQLRATLHCSADCREDHHAIAV